MTVHQTTSVSLLLIARHSCHRPFPFSLGATEVTTHDGFTTSAASLRILTPDHPTNICADALSC